MFLYVKDSASPHLLSEMVQTRIFHSSEKYSIVYSSLLIDGNDGPSGKRVVVAECLLISDIINPGVSLKAFDFDKPSLIKRVLDDFVLSAW